MVPRHSAHVLPHDRAPVQITINADTSLAANRPSADDGDTGAISLHSRATERNQRLVWVGFGADADVAEVFNYVLNVSNLQVEVVDANSVLLTNKP
jgi:hypothetical protein